MLKNYLKIAVRNILKNKVYSFINIIGLSVGMAACILIALYVIKEESYDRLNKNADRIVRATMMYSFNGMKDETAYTGTKLLPAFKQNFPEVENGVRMYSTKAIVKYQNEVFNEPNFAYADSTFFKVFSFKLLHGDPERALVRPYSIILTKSAAKKYFGNENPIGKVIKVNMRILLTVSWNEYTVTGVMQDCPSNSQIKFDFLASFCSLPIAKPGDEQWWEADYFTYLLLKSPEFITTLQAKIPSYMKTQNKENGLTGNDNMTFHLQPLKRVHLYPRVQDGFEPPGNYQYVILFSLVAILILVIACANYMNLMTAKSSERAKEIGVRKVVGALRKQLIYQFMNESLIVVFSALILGLMIVELLLPAFNSLSAKQFGISFSHLSIIVLIVAALGLLVSLLGSGYPAFILSKFHPVKILRGNFKSGLTGLRLRKTLIVIQFVISVALIISTLIIQAQMNYILKRDLGFNKNSVAVLPIDDSMKGKIDALKNEFLNNSNISAVTFTTSTPVSISSKGNILYNNRKIIANQIGIDQDFLKTLEIKLIAGHNFTPADTFSFFSAAPIGGWPIVLNETAVEQLEITPQDAIGMQVVWGGRNCRIKGVIKDFNFSSMHNFINPLVLFPNGFLNEMMIRLSGTNLQQVINYMKTKWDILFPNHPFDMTFLNDDFNRLYVSETRTEKIFYIFTFLAVVLAFLGLFGIVTFSVQQRTKEIGIRKTLGAGTINIIAMLSKDYLKLILIANIIACPIAWYAINKWLEGFAYRTEVKVWIFFLVMLVTFAMVIIMIALQATKAATRNPVKSLRYE